MSNLQSSIPPSTGAGQSSAELLQLYQRSGSEDALRRLIQLYLPLVHATARRRSGSESLAVDVVQTVLIDFARQARSMPRNVQIGGWLLRHTGFRASRALRTERRRAAREAEALRRHQLLPDPNPMSGEMPDHSLLAEALDRLPAACQSLLIMKYYEALETPDIATRLGISVAAAQKRTERALQELRRLMPATAAGAGGLSSGPAPTVATVGLSLGVSQMLLRSSQAAGLPAKPLVSQWTAEALAAAAARPLPAPLVRLRHLSAASGVAAGIAAALICCSVPVWNSWTQNPHPVAAASGIVIPAAVPGGAMQQSVDIDDVFTKLKALLASEGNNRVAWRKAEELLMTLPGRDIPEAIVRLDQMFRLPRMSGPPTGPSRWISLLLWKWKPASVPDGLCRLLPRLSPGVADYAAMSVCRDWFKDSGPAASAWLQNLLADDSHALLPEQAQKILARRLGYYVMEDLLVREPAQAERLAGQMRTGGFEIIQAVGLIHLQTASAMASREAITEAGHPWYLPVKEVTEGIHSPAEKRALTDKIGDPGTRQTLAELVADTIFVAADSFFPLSTAGSKPQVSELTATADWLLAQTPAARRGMVLRSIASGWSRLDAEGAEAWFAHLPETDRAVMDREKSKVAATSDLAPAASISKALSITDPEVRDYTLAARVAAETTSENAGSILTAPELPATTLNALRQWLAITP